MSKEKMTTNKKRNAGTIAIVLALLLFVGCGSKSPVNGIEIVRYEKLLFETQPQEMHAALKTFASENATPLLTIYPDDPGFMKEIEGFVADPVVRDIYNITNKRYGDLAWLQRTLSEAMKKADKVDDEIKIAKVYTLVSGMVDYDKRIMVDRESGTACICLDLYALPQMEKYSYFSMPMFIVERCDSAYLAADFMAAVARKYIVAPDEKNVSMLDFMISEGKVLYFLDQVLPRTEDFIKIRYTAEQMEWMKKNESQVWTYFIKNDLLYEKDFTRFHNFVDEAPKTNAFNNSAPRTTDYIGWQIVKNYMKTSGCSMKELFDNNNAQQILQESGYKP